MGEGASAWLSPRCCLNMCWHTHARTPTSPPFPWSAVPAQSTDTNAGFLTRALFLVACYPAQGEASDRVMVVFASNQVHTLNPPRRAHERGWACACDELFELRAR